MAIENFSLRVNRDDQPASEVIQRRQRLRKTEEVSENNTFGNMLKDAINSVDLASKTADQQVADVVAGKSENIHEAMISMQKAQLSFQLMVEIRNKAIETYHEIARMQI